MHIVAWAHKHVGIILVTLVMLWTSVAVVYHLGTEPLQDYDESTYAQVAHEIRTEHHLCSLTYAGNAYVRKPPLLFWFMSASGSVLGETPFDLRLPSALSGIALVALVILLAFELSGSSILAAFAGAILATTSPYIEAARQVRMDVLVTLCIVATVYFFVRAMRAPTQTQQGWFLLFGVAAGLAILAKSVIAAFALVPVMCIIVLCRQLAVLWNKRLWYGIGATIFVAAPWHIYETVRLGSVFWQQYIGVEVIARTHTNAFGTVINTNDILLRYFEQFCQPWLLLSCISGALLVVGWSTIECQRRAFVVSCIITVTCIATLFFSTATKAPTYFLPLYPFAALAIALSIPPIPSRLLRALLPGVLVCLVLVAAQFTIYNAYHLNPYYAYTVTLAQEESVVAALINKTPLATPWYAYGDEELGSIKFYTQRLDPLAVSDTSTPTPGSLIVTYSSAYANFLKEYPTITTTTLYRGRHVTLLRVVQPKEMFRR